INLESVLHFSKEDYKHNLRGQLSPEQSSYFQSVEKKHLFQMRLLQIVLPILGLVVAIGGPLSSDFWMPPTMTWNISFSWFLGIAAVFFAALIQYFFHRHKKKDPATRNL